MSQPHPANSDPDPWPACDDDQPGVTIRPLSHADLAAFLAEWDDDDDEEPLPRPLPTRPPRTDRQPATPALATVGRAGGSAQAEYRCRRAAELAAWMPTLPMRLATIATVGVITGLLAGTLVEPPATILVAVAAAAAVGWRLRFQPSPDTRAWRRGASGERRTAALLARLEQHGWVVLHDLAVPGSRANLDHLLIGPPGIFVIDSKRYRGRVWLDPDGSLWHGRYPLAASLRAAAFEADRAAAVLNAPGVPTLAVLAIHGASVSWGELVAGGVPVLAAGRLLAALRALPGVLTPGQVAELADRARAWLRPAA
jgi:hypothetical protein